MNNKISAHSRDLAGASFAALIAIVTFFMAAPLDPEPYHDGSQLPAAIGVSEGLVVHRDVFSAYGFITAWLQGLAVKIFGADLLTIRLFTACVLVVVTVLIFVIARLTTRSALIAAGIAALWVVTWPGQAVIWGTPLLPWPSVVYLVFQLGAVIFAARALERDVHRSLYLSLAGALTALAILTRINYGVAFALALAVTFILFSRSAHLNPKNYLALISGFIAALAIPLGVIAIQGGFVAFLDQSVVGPLQGKAIVKATEWFYLKNAYLWGSVLLIISLIVVGFVGARKWVNTRWLVVLVVLDIAGLLAWTSAAIEGSPVRTLILSKITWAPALDGQAMQSIFLAAVATVLLFLTLVTVVVLRIVRRKTIIALGDEKSRRNQIFIVLLTLTSAASLVQLYPVADPNHLWWAAPLPLVLLVYAALVNVNKRSRYALAAVLIVPSLIIATVTAKTFWSKPRTTISSGVLSGMKIDASLAANVAKVDAMLLNVSPRTAEFICKEGLFAVWSGTYLAAGPGYVDYSYNLESADQAMKPTKTFICSPWGDTKLASEYAKAHDMHIVRESGQIILSYFSNTQISELVSNK